MATLFNTKISQTYEGLLKTIDNAAISATLRELTDGSGNQSGLYLNTAGDFKVSAILEWGSLKDTGTGVTITRFVTSTDGLENFDNNTSLPTSAAVKLYVDTKFSQTDTLTEVLGFGNTTSGKDIAVSAGDDITLTTTSKIIMGTSGAAGNFQIYNDGSNSYISENGAGDLRISTNAAQVAIQNSLTENMARFIVNNAVILYYDNVNKFQTTTAGAQVTGDLVVTGTITGSGGSFLPLAGGTMTGNIVLNDNVKTSYGTSADFEIYHNTSTNSNFIQSNLSRQLILAQDNIFIGNQAASESMITAIADGAVSLYYDNSNKLETTNTGAKVNGFIQVTNGVDVTGGNIDLLDNSKIRLGTSQDLQIYHDDSNSYISDTGVGALKILASEFQLNNVANTGHIIKGFQAGAVELNYNLNKKFETLTDGAKVTGNLEVTGTITGAGGSFLPLIGGTMTGDTIHNDDVKSIYGTASDGLEIFHDGNSRIKDTGTGSLILSASGFFVQNLTNNLITGSAGGTVSLYFNGSEKLRTKAAGLTITGDGDFTGNVSVPDSAFLYAGTSDNLSLTHNGTDSIIRNYTGDFYINQGAVTQSIIFKVSDANALDTTALTISRNGDLTTGRDVTIAGDLTVNGTTTTVNSQTLAVVDPLIQLAKDNTANSLDIGLYGDYNDGTGRYLGLFSDASDGNKFKLFKGTTVEPTTTVNIGGAGYVAADLELANLVATGNINLADNGKAIFGTGNDLQIYHDGSNSYIQDTGTGNLEIRSNFLKVKSPTAEDMIWAQENAGVTLFHNNVSKLTTTSTGVSVSGDVVTTGTSFIGKASTSSYVPDDGVFGGIITNGGGFKITTQAIDTMTLSAVGGNMTIRGGGTFGGNVNVTGGITVNDTLNSVLELNTSNANCDITMQSVNTSSLTRLRNGTNDFQVHTNGTLGLTIDSSQNSTFAGNVGAISYTGKAYPFNGEFLGGADVASANLQAGSTSGYATGVKVYGGGNATPNIITMTTASVERMRIDSSGNVDLTSGGLLKGMSAIELKNNGSTDASATSPRLYSPASGTLAFSGNGSEKMRIDSSGNVGIGTDSPSDYYSDNLVVKQASGAGGITIVTDTSSEGALYFADGTSGNQRYEGGVGYNHSINKLFLVSGGQSRLFIDSTGNVGIGTASPNAKLEIESTSNPVLRISNGGGLTPNPKIELYRQGGVAGSVEYSAANKTMILNNISSLGGFNFNIAGSTKMAIDLNGNVGIGTDSPRGILDLKFSGNGTLSNTTSEYQLVLEAPSGTSNYGRNIGWSESTGVNVITSAINAVDDGASSSTGLTFSTGNSSTLTERMRITSAGVVQVKNSASPTLQIYNTDTFVAVGQTLGKLDFYSTDGAKVSSYIEAEYTSAQGSSELIFATSESTGAATERMRISSGGNVLIGATDVPDGTSHFGSGFIPVSTGKVQLRMASNSDIAGSLILFQNPNGTVGNITINGFTTAYNTSSDYRLKEDLQDFAGLDMVSKIPVYDFKWKTDESRSYGVMAHELQEVLPDAVSGEKDAEEMQGVDYSKIVPLLVKSIQELKAEIDILKSQNCKCKI